MTSETVPEGWALCTVGDIGQLIRGITYRKEQSAKEPAPLLMPILRASNISGSLNYDDLVYVPRSLVSAEQKIVNGDIIFAMSSGSLHLVGKSAQAHANFDGSCGSFCAILRLDEEISKKYFAYLFSTNSFRRKISEIAKGSNINNLKRDHILEHRVVLPPFKEQQRILARVEELLSELDKGVENLKLAWAQLIVYRQALLKHAFEGKLTADWRADNASQLEGGERLISRIKVERNTRYQKLLAEWHEEPMACAADNEKKQQSREPREPKILRPLDSAVRKKLTPLPPSWAWDCLGHMTSGVEYGSAAKSEKAGTHVVLRMGNLQSGKIDWSDLAFSNDAEEIDQYLLRSGDVLFNRTNSPEWVGKTSMYRSSRPALFAGYLIRVNHCEEVVLGEYLNWFLNSPIAKQHSNTVKTDGVNQSNINGDKLMHYPFPYCSLAEQAEIVRVIEGMISLIDNSVDEIEINLKKSESLRQSILKKAFTGELVPQDVSEEPAAALLARTRADRVSAANASKPKIKSPRASKE